MYVHTVHTYDLHMRSAWVEITPKSIYIHDNEQRTHFKSYNHNLKVSLCHNVAIVPGGGVINSLTLLKVVEQK